MESSLGPDSITNQYFSFLAFFHYKDSPIIYKNDSTNDFNKLKIEPINVEYTMNKAIDIIKDSLQNNQNNLIKSGLIDSLMMRYIIHCVGDIHQPLHTASLYSKFLFEGEI